MDKHFRTMTRFAALLTALVLAAGAGCSGVLTAPPARVLDGHYGGEGIGLDVTASQTGLSFDCAGGAIRGPIPLAPDGSFDVAGTFTGAGNAFGADHSPHAVHYRGRASRDVVRLVIVDSSGSSGMDTLVAVLGAPRFVAAC